MTVARSFASIKKHRDFAQWPLPGTVSIKKDRDFGRKTVASSSASIKKHRDFRPQAFSSGRIAILANDRCQELCLYKKGSWFSSTDCFQELRRYKNGSWFYPTTVAKKSFASIMLQLVDIVLSDRERLLRIMLNSQLALNMAQQECNRQNPKDRNPVSFPSRLYVLGCRGGNQSKSFQCHDSWQFRIGLAYIWGAWYILKSLTLIGN